MHRRLYRLHQRQTNENKRGVIVIAVHSGSENHMLNDDQHESALLIIR